MLAIQCVACQAYLPILTKNVKTKTFTYAWCIECGILYDGINKGAKKLQESAKEVPSSQISEEQLKWLKKKISQE